MQLELNSNVSGLSHAWQNAKGFKPIDGVYYVVAVFESAKCKPTEVFTVIVSDGQYYSVDYGDLLDFSTFHENDSHTVLIHPVPSLSTEISEV